MRRTHSDGEEARDLAPSADAAASPVYPCAGDQVCVDGRAIPAEAACPVAATPHFLPSRPWGRNASTATMMRKVPTTA